MLLSYEYRLYPTKAQVQFLESQLREACDLYNAALQERRDAWKVCHKSINYYDQANQLKQIRAEGLIRLANFSCCQDVLRRLDKTFQAFFARVQRGDHPGFPRFRPACGSLARIPACGLRAARDVVSAQVILHCARVGCSRHNVEDVVSCVPREAVAFQATE
jgi:transposase